MEYSFKKKTFGKSHLILLINIFFNSEQFTPGSCLRM
jgi:hypothetical protein